MIGCISNGPAAKHISSHHNDVIFILKSLLFHLLFSLFAGSGGISLKPSSSMDAMRADMGGAATVCASIVTAAALKLPVNIIGEFRNMCNTLMFL